MRALARVKAEATTNLFTDMRKSFSKLIATLLFAANALCAMASTEDAGSLSPSTKWHWDKGQIVIESPERPKGQKHALGLALPKMEVVRVGFVGLGMRGAPAVQRFTHIPGTHIVGLCDYRPENAHRCQETLRSAGLPPAEEYSGEDGYKKLCKRKDVDLIYIATDWEHHFTVAEYALKHGKNVAIEVPAAMNLEQIWALIDLAEAKQLHCIMLENCCYDWYEMTAMNIAQQGILGEIVYAEGAYIHTLSPYWDQYWKNPKDESGLGWRLKYNMESRGDVYSTHGLGPVAQALDIHRGDRFTTLVAMDTKSVVGKDCVKQRSGTDCSNFRNGDHTTTLLRTAKGKVVNIQHNVMTPQPYNRLYKLTGTLGYATKYPYEQYSMTTEALGKAGFDPNITSDGHSFLPAEIHNELVSRYEHPILKKYKTIAKEVGGHGGMDFIMDSRMIYCLQNGLPMDIDVYDLAEWCCLAELGALSMDNNCASVAVPDFTRGHWQDKQGFSHAFATPEQEAEAEAKAKAATKELKDRTIQQKLWEKQ